MRQTRDWRHVEMLWPGKHRSWRDKQSYVWMNRVERGEWVWVGGKGLVSTSMG